MADQNPLATDAENNSDDPYRVTQIDKDNSEPERLLDRDPAAESALKQYSLALVGHLILICGAIMLPVIGPMMDPTESLDALTQLLCGLTFVIAAVAIVVNWGVRRMDAWARFPLTVLCVLQLFIPPFGTGFALETLRILYTGSRPRPLTSAYEQMVRETPSENPKTSVLTWIGLILIVVLVVSMFVISQLQSDAN